MEYSNGHNPELIAPKFAGKNELLLSPAALKENNKILREKFEWLNSIFRMHETGDPTTITITDPEITEGNSPIVSLENKLGISTAEKCLLLLALEPHYFPSGITSRQNLMRESQKRLSDALAYYQDPFSGNYYPTLQTALQLLSGNNPDRWRDAELALIHNGKLLREQIIVLREVDDRARIGNRLNMLIDLAPEYVDYILHGQKPRPDFGRAFPAHWISTNLGWDQLVLNKITRDEITDVMDWVEHRDNVLSRSENKINASFPCLFYGPPGTGKSFTAKLIGKQYGKDVFRIDLSMIVSKYIGETEKNLAQLFDRAEGKGWILFFDEADALFGKRTGISDSKDKWANLEMSYLLQRMEEYQGLCILATNLKHNLDPALSRRFQAMIHFPFPKEEERALIWEKSLPPGFHFPTNISFEKLSRFELSGAGIANVIKSSCVKAAKRGDYIMTAEDITRFIRIEFAKDGRTV
jgi:hypothetical protein